ncbi:MAG: alpha-L-glutamate ligase-like protein [Thermoplasmata archaeon]|nr:MAG: alpha-L-glutamate ligase-like protein [Thermoplasmata archaeon]
MLNYTEVLGVNRRNLRYVDRCNGKKDVLLANNKLATKAALSESGIPVPKTLATVENRRDLLTLNFESLYAFALKPNSGRGGRGILIISGRENGGWRGPQDRYYERKKLMLHALDILDGYHSRRNNPDIAYFEDLVRPDPMFNRISSEGLSDIRVIVYKGKPVLAMVRLPTKHSCGKANLHQGAVGVGVDIDSGLTSWAVCMRRFIENHPDTGMKLRGLHIPNWEKILAMSMGCYESTRIGYMGVDVVLDGSRGPMVLELNAHPGLDIQLANKIGLREPLSIIDTI